MRAWTADVVHAADPGDNAARLELIRALEELKCAAERLQADLAVEVDTTMREVAAEHGVPEARREQGVAAEIALARRESHHRGQQSLGLAKVLRHEMPFTREALRAGRITGWRATIIARETACLSRQDRLEVDRLERMGDRELGNAPYAGSPTSWTPRPG